MVVEAKVHGLPDYKAALMGLPAKLRKRALRNALAAGARVVRDEAKRLAPVLKAPTKYRAVGTVRNSIRVRTSKQARQKGDVGVFVNVQPPKRGLVNGVKQRGAKSKLDNFYWVFMEFGRKGRMAQAARQRVVRNAAHKFVSRGVRARRALRAVGPIAAVKFLQRAAAKLPLALEKFKAVIGPQIQKLNTTPKDPL